VIINFPYLIDLIGNRFSSFFAQIVVEGMFNPSQIVQSVQHRLLYIRYRTIVLYMTDVRKLLGSTKVSTDNKVTIVKDAATILKIDKGDVLAFFLENGRIYIEKG
jgi:hypothetical protein